LNLGLNEDTCTAATARVMCENVQFQNATILASECQLARENAAMYVQRKWGITVKP
jgi:hypothetical protein